MQGKASPCWASVYLAVQWNASTLAPHDCKAPGRDWSTAGVHEMVMAEEAAGRVPDISPDPESHQLGNRDPSREGLVSEPGLRTSRPRMLSRWQGPRPQDPKGGWGPWLSIGRSPPGLRTKDPRGVSNSKRCVLLPCNMHEAEGLIRRAGMSVCLHRTHTVRL